MCFFSKWKFKKMVFLYLCMEHLVRTKENSVAGGVVAGAVDRRHSKD